MYCEKTNSMYTIQILIQFTSPSVTSVVILFSRKVTLRLEGLFILSH